MNKFLLILFTLFITNCNNTKIAEKNSTNKKTKSYNNYKTYSLSKKLKEISGLSYANNFLYTHNDENGILFKLNTSNGQILEQIKFGKDNDYEGLEVVNNVAYIIKSNGKGIEYNLKEKTSSSFNTGLKHENNIEGICLNFYNSNELLLACKGTTLNKDKKNKKAIYSYNYTSKTLNTKPYLSIDIKTLKEFVKNNNHPKKIEKKHLKRITKFAPSGLAFNPKNGNLYIISARGSSLIIYQKKKLKNIIFLDKNTLPQPEGICFDANNTLYISSEGKKTSEGIICKFTKL